MPTYPNKLLIMFPMYQPVGYRHQLVAIDDALVVHRHGSGGWQFELRPLVKLTARGPNSYRRALERLAADLEAGHTVVIVEPDKFLADLETQARQHMTPNELVAVEKAAQVVSERTVFQVRNALDGSNAQYRANRFIIASRQRRVKANRSEGNSLNCRNGIPTPRAEQLWNVIRHELTDVRDNQAGLAAWERWCDRNRPDMPRGSG